MQRREGGEEVRLVCVGFDLPGYPNYPMEASWWSRTPIGEVLHVADCEEGQTNFPVWAVLAFEIAGVRGNLVEVKCVGHNRLHRRSFEIPLRVRAVSYLALCIFDCIWC